LDIRAHLKHGGGGTVAQERAVHLLQGLALHHFNVDEAKAEVCVCASVRRGLLYGKRGLLYGKRAAKETYILGKETYHCTS
jgi:hypothetical protein